MKDIFTTSEDEQKTLTVTERAKICRHKSKSFIYNRQQAKIYRKVYDKRVLLDNYHTLPYGY